MGSKKQQMEDGFYVEDSFSGMLNAVLNANPKRKWIPAFKQINAFDNGLASEKAITVLGIRTAIDRIAFQVLGTEFREQLRETVATDAKFSNACRAIMAKHNYTIGQTFDYLVKVFVAAAMPHTVAWLRELSLQKSA